MRSINFQTSFVSAVLLGFLVGCGSTASNTSTSATTSTSTSGGTSISGTLAITQANPPAGNVSVVPTSIVLSFNESSLDDTSDSTAVNNPANFSFVCGGVTNFATSASDNGQGAVTVSFSPISVPGGTTCILTASQNIQDTSGNWLASGQTVTYVVSGGAGVLSVNSFSPPSETVSTMPTSVSVVFSESALDLTGDAYSATSAANYAYVCGGVSYPPTSAALVSGGTVALTLPSISVAAGSSCVLTVLANVHDSSGNAVSGVATATYLSSGAAAWNEAASVSLTNAYGNGDTGSGFYDVASTGLVMTGIATRSGAYVDQVNGLWTVGFGGTVLISGPTYGGSGGSSNGNLTCPSNMRLTGLFGTYDNQIDSIGIICGSADQTQSFHSAAVGGNGANSFQLSCPSGLFATDFAGISGNYVQELQLGCR